MSTIEFGRLWLIVMCVAFAGMCPNVLADNWPGWRGPLQNGVSQETKVPTVWSKDKNVRWQVDIPGTGHSSPIVWDDAIFVTTSMPGDLTRHVLRVQRETGAVLWNKLVATSPIETMHRDNSPASSTPLTDGQRVYACFCVDGRLMVTALSMQGETVWTAYPGTFQSQHGFCTALVTDGQHLFVSGLQDGADAFVAALDCLTGETTWKVKRPHAIRSYSTPCLCEIDQQPALLLSGADQTIAYHRLTGATLWVLAGPSEKTVSSIVVSEVDQLAFVCGGRDKKFFAVRLNDLGKSAEKSEERIVWTANKGIPYMNSPLVYNGLLHIMSDEGVYRCYRAATGEVLNERRIGGSVKASMVATPEHIYITNTDGKTTVIANDEHGKVLAVNDIGEEVVASPAISNGDFIVRTQSKLLLIR